MKKYNKNSIMTSNLDMLCLVCNIYLKSTHEADMHILLPIHKKNYSKTDYIEKYEDDRIKKVSVGYYCEICNLLFPILSKINLHINEESHIMNKKSNVLKRERHHILAYDELLIDVKSWHGLKDNACCICITEFHNEDIHKTHISHVINLIQKKIVFGPHKAIYRLVDDNTYQCLICNSILSKNFIESHLNEAIHHEHMKKCSELYNAFINNNEIKIPTNFYDVDIKNETKLQITNNTVNSDTLLVESEHEIVSDPKIKPISAQMDDKPEEKDFEDFDFNSDIKRSEIGSSNIISDLTTSYNNDITTKERNLDKILENVQKFEKNEVNINFETETAFCKKCFTNIDFNFVSIKKHIDEKIHTAKERFLSHYVPFQCEAKTSEPLKKTDNKHKNFTSVTNTSTTNDISAPIVPYYSKDYGNVNGDRNKGNENHEESDQSSIDDNMDINDDSNKAENDPVTYAKTNHLTYNKNNRNTYCRICEKKFPSSLHSMKEHVNGAKHKMLLLKSEMTVLKKISSRIFFDDVSLTKDLAFINNKYCLSKLSFFMLSPVHPYILKCDICEILLYEEQASSHVKSDSHSTVFRDIPVVTSLTNEFVRQATSGMFHCGFCNHYINGWINLNTHLKTEDHIKQASKFQRLLLIYLPRLREYKLQQMRQNNYTLNLYKHFLFN
ncbi:uncharacterized protein LOC131843724 [Achroia grisella]|uniref:uncharacterized protein LOC131843724 n=1 Tax=Achroia grisella TaxID=688607 RepID=UPI0027D2D564|nr:uncharacterized protein LOC131843724 [Achroia grisella]XP_059048428.1 uncharacterized protein LOC131843724 [Achroia grisella]